MTTSLRLALLSLVAVATLAVPAAHAACSSARCPDEAAVEAVRARVAASCDCTGAKSPRKYMTCAKQVIRAALGDGSLPAKCKKVVKGCEGQSVCGRKDATICCQMAKGKVKARVMKGKAKCGGASCAFSTHLADACTAQAACAVRPGAIKPFRAIQAVLATSCALSSCHSALARQGGLVLSSEELSYAALVDRPSTHPDAKAAGLLRVKSGDPDASFLLRKLRGLGPGDAMPVGGRLSPAVLQMVEQWIARGAHATAEECPALPSEGPRPLHGTSARTICDDEPIDPGPFQWVPEPGLEVPAPGDGIQLYTPPLDVPIGQEWETCIAFRPNWEEIAAQIGLPAPQLPVIREQVYRMHEGSHHLLLWAYIGDHPDAWPEGYFRCSATSCENPADCPPDTRRTLPIGGTQVAGTRYDVKYPQGVGIPVFGKNVVLIANLHYTNVFQPPQSIYGEAWLNLYFHRPNETKASLDGIFAINSRDLIVEPYTTKTISAIWQPTSLLTRQPVDAAVFQLFGHMHKRGTSFQIDVVRGGKCSVTGRACGRDQDCACKPWQNPCTPGQTCVRGATAEDTPIYYTTSWDNAPIHDFEKPYLLVGREEGLRWTCTHTNGVEGDPMRPPKRCHEGCDVCGWDPASRTCIFQEGVDNGIDATPRVFREGDPMPLGFGELADDDMCNMFGYFINQADLSKLP
jgi:hypothetical protein